MATLPPCDWFPSWLNSEIVNLLSSHLWINNKLILKTKQNKKQPQPTQIKNYQKYFQKNVLGFFCLFVCFFSMFILCSGSGRIFIPRGPVEVRGQLVRVDFLSLCSPLRPTRDQTLWKSQSSRESHLGSGPQLKQNRRLKKARVTFFCCSIPVSYHMEAITPHNLGADYSVFDGISSVRNSSSRDSGVTVLHTWLRKSSCSPTMSATPFSA